MKLIPGKIMCDCGHVESAHSSFTRGYGTDRDGKTYCYNCCLVRDIEYLKREKNLSAYLSSDGKHITTWPGDIIATVTGSHVVNLGFRRNQTSFDAIMPDGTKLYGYGPGPGMFCRIKVRRHQS